MSLLPEIHNGEVAEVKDFTLADRKKYGLSTPKSIIKIWGDNSKVEEAVAYAKKKGLIAFDLETTGLDPHTDDIVLVQIGDLERQYLIWYRSIDPAPISDLLADEKVTKAGINLKFDLSFWMAKHGTDHRCWNPADAMLVEQILCCGLLTTSDENIGLVFKQTSMESLAKRWLGIGLMKDEELRTSWDQIDSEEGSRNISQDQMFYAADDCIIPIKILQCQKPWVKQLNLAKTVNLELAYLPVIAEMEVRGLKIDKEAWGKLADEAEIGLIENERKLDTLFEVTETAHQDIFGNVTISRDKNYGSKDQLGNLIRDWVQKTMGVNLIVTNEHFKEALLEHTGLNPDRLDKVFEAKLVPNPKKTKGKKMWVGRPDMSDIVEKKWDDWGPLLPDNTVCLPNTNSKTLKLFRLIYSGATSDLDPKLPTRIGLPPAVVDPIVKLRYYAKNTSTYGYSWLRDINEKTDRLHPDFSQTALATGRLSSSPNVQNPPSDQRYRSCFIPEKGYKYVGADWSQIEPRIIAQISKDPVYLRVFHSERPGTPGFRAYCKGVQEVLDLYVEVGKSIGVIPAHFTNKDCKDPDEGPPTSRPEGKAGRKKSKVSVLGLGYGTGMFKFWITLMLDTQELISFEYAAKLFHTYWQKMSAVKEALDKLSALADPEESERKVYHPYTRGTVTYAESLGGRKRFINPRFKGSFTVGRNTPIQATGADIMKKTAVLLARWIWKNNLDAAIVNKIHDEFIVECKEDIAEMVRNKMTDFMVLVGESYCPDVPISATAYIGDHWIKD